MRLGETGTRVVFGLAAALALAALVTGRLTAQEPSTLALLNQYASGKFADVNATLARTENFKRIYKDLKHDDVLAWLDGGGPADRPRRELAAATFALEAARADEWYEWKWLQNPPIGSGRVPILYWMPPPLLIEWGCELLRQRPEPRPIERVWQLAAMAVGQRSEDTQFLIGFTQIEIETPPDLAPEPSLSPTPRPNIPGMPSLSMGGGRSFPDEVLNVQKEIGHLNHVIGRFPDEKRFVLGQALARERPTPNDAARLYTAMLTDQMVGGEAAMRLGALYLRQGRIADALPLFARAELLTRDRDVIYLARFYRGQAMVKLRREADAIAAYRSALDARPGSQSASVGLALILASHDGRAEAQTLMKAVLDKGADYKDPHLEYMHGDERFWPTLVEKLYAEIRK